MKSEIELSNALAQQMQKGLLPCPSAAPSRGRAERSALTFRGWAEQRAEHGHEATWVLSTGLGKVILGKPCPADEVRVKGTEQRTA